MLKAHLLTFLKKNLYSFRSHDAKKFLFQSEHLVTNAEGQNTQFVIKTIAWFSKNRAIMCRNDMLMHNHYI